MMTYGRGRARWVPLDHPERGKEPKGAKCRRQALIPIGGLSYHTLTALWQNAEKTLSSL